MFPSYSSVITYSSSTFDLLQELLIQSVREFCFLMLGFTLYPKNHARYLKLKIYFK